MLDVPPVAHQERCPRHKRTHTGEKAWYAYAAHVGAPLPGPARRVPAAGGAAVLRTLFGERLPRPEPKALALQLVWVPSLHSAGSVAVVEALT